MTIKRVFFAVLAVLAILTVVIHEAFLFRPDDTEWAHIAPFRWWLLAHVVPGVVAFAVVPLQFSNTIRRRSLDLHRWLGRVYVSAVVVAGSTAFWINLAFEPAALVPSGLAQAGLWIGCTGAAWFAARNRAVAQHRLWASRSYGLAFTFVTSRLIPDMPFFPPTEEALANLVWGLIAASFLLPDLIFHGRALLPLARGPATSPLPQDAVVAELVDALP